MTTKIRLLVSLAVIIPTLAIAWLIKFAVTESREQRARLARIEAAQQSNLTSIEEAIRGMEMKQMRSALGDMQMMMETKSEVADMKATLEAHLRKLEYESLTKRPKSP